MYVIEEPKKHCSYSYLIKSNHLFLHFNALSIRLLDLSDNTKTGNPSKEKKEKRCVSVKSFRCYIDATFPLADLTKMTLFVTGKKKTSLTNPMKTSPMLIRIKCELNLVREDNE